MKFVFEKIQLIFEKIQLIFEKNQLIFDIMNWLTLESTILALFDEPYFIAGFKKKKYFLSKDLAFLKFHNRTDVTIYRSNMFLQGT